MQPPPDSFDDLVRRHASGERSPDLMWALNRAAFNLFHAPWEEPPGSSFSVNPSLTEGHLPLDSSEDVPLSRAPVADPKSRLLAPVLRVEDGLKALGHQVYTCPPDALLVELEHDADSDRIGSLRFKFDPRHKVLTVQALSDFLVMPEAEASLREWCLAWNRRSQFCWTVLHAAEERRLRLEGHWFFPADTLCPAHRIESLLKVLFNAERAFWGHARHRTLPSA